MSNFSSFLDDNKITDNNILNDQSSDISDEFKNDFIKAIVKDYFEKGMKTSTAYKINSKFADSLSIIKTCLGKVLLVCNYISKNFSDLVKTADIENIENAVLYIIEKNIDLKKISKTIKDELENLLQLKQTQQKKQQLQQPGQQQKQIIINNTNEGNKMAEAAIKTALTTLGITQKEEQDNFINILEKVKNNITDTEDLETWINKQSTKDQGKKLKQFLTNNKKHFNTIDNKLFGIIESAYGCCELNNFVDYNAISNQFDNDMYTKTLTATNAINNNYYELNSIEINENEIKNPVINIFTYIKQLETENLQLNNDKEQLKKEVDIYKNKEINYINTITNLNQKVKKLSEQNAKLNNTFKFLNNSFSQHKIKYTNALKEQQNKILNATNALNITEMGPAPKKDITSIVKYE